MCVAALLLGIATFYVEMGLSRYAKLNSVTSKTWMATSGSDLETRLNTDLFVSKVYDITDEDHFDYIGTQVVVGKGDVAGAIEGTWHMTRRYMLQASCSTAMRSLVRDIPSITSPMILT